METGRSQVSDSEQDRGSRTMIELKDDELARTAAFVTSVGSQSSTRAVPRWKSTSAGGFG